ncbi:MAG TPA: hypothetical protein VJV05_01730 [Pyrinomonadaceae bacterium]|nr:hypothetical protein [Pyrinomonadaceae bacterium]
MKRSIRNILFGKDNKLSGAIAIAVIAFIALGCGCGKDFDLAKVLQNANSSSNSGTDSSNSTTSDDSTSSDADMPSRDLLDAMVAETTADFNFAIVTNDFSDMYAKASPNFQATYTEAEFKKAFKEFVDQKKMVAPILSKAVSMDPEYSPEPSIRNQAGQDILTVKGKYPTKPLPLTFEYEYINRDGDWKLLKLVVRIV